MSYVKLNSLQSDGSSQVTTTRTRLRNVYATSSASAGFIRIRDGGSAGAVRFEVTTPGTVDIFVPIEFPKDGILCETDMYVENSNLTSATFVFDAPVNAQLLELGVEGWLHVVDGSPLELSA